MTTNDEATHPSRKQKRTEEEVAARDELLLRAEVVELLQLAREFQRTLATLENRLGGRIPEALERWSVGTVELGALEQLSEVLERWSDREALERWSDREALERWSERALEQDKSEDGTDKSGGDSAHGPVDEGGVR